MPNPKDTYLGKLSGGATKPPIPWDRINFSSSGATAPKTPVAPKAQFINNAATPTDPSLIHSAPLPGPGSAPAGVPTGTGTSGTSTGGGYNYINGKAVPTSGGYQNGSSQDYPDKPGTNDTATPSDYEKETKAAFDSYLASMNMSPEHKAAQDYLNSLITQQKNDIGAVDAHAGQTTSFAGAEKERINYNASNSIDAASRALSVFADSDQSREKMADARYQYESKKQENARQAAKDAATAATSAQNALPASAQEYEYAKKQGYKGTYEQYQNEDANRKAKAAGSSNASTNAAQADDVAQAILDFQDQMTSKGWAGANPNAYEYYRAELTKLYGASAALALDQAMRIAGIVVDRKNA